MAGHTTYVAADGAPIGKIRPLSGVCCHQRATITNTAGPLGSFITSPIGQNQSGIPYYLAPALPVPTNKVFPKAVDIQIESGQDAAIYATWDGHDTALGDVSATLGMNVIQVAKGWTRIPVDCTPTEGENGTGLIRVISSAGSVTCQLAFEF